jgi:hypothetical protein
MAASGDEAPRSKPAWLMDDSERLARRFDPVAAAARLRLAVAEGDVPVNSGAEDAVFGRHNPELFLPWELLDDVYGVFNLDPAAQRQRRDKWVDRGAPRLLGDDFWTRLQELLRPLIVAEGELKRVHLAQQAATGAARRALLVEASRHLSDSLCPLRAKALEAAREAFGRETFDRFLYEVVAPESGSYSGSSAGLSGMASGLLWVAEGCK